MNISNNEAKQFLSVNNEGYLFKDMPIDNSIFTKIVKGKWRRLTSDQITKRLHKRQLKKEHQQAYKEVYEAILSSTEGQYALGVGLEKAANEFYKTVKKLKREGRRLVNKNKQKYTR